MTLMYGFRMNHPALSTCLEWWLWFCNIACRGEVEKHCI